MANRFVLNETSYHGKGAIESIPEEAKARGFKKALVCSDPDLVKFGVTAKVTDLLDKAGLAYELYSNIKPNPTIENVQQGVKALHDAGADYMIAIGGGSSMDTAKAVAAIVTNGKTTVEWGDVELEHSILPLICIPSTAGTGSETTLAAVITDAETRHKYAINDFPLIPRYAVLDPKVTLSLPPFITATTGMDALTHAVEAYIGNSTTPGTRKNALDAVRLIFENLDTAYTHGNDIEARRNMLRASYFAGCAFTKSYVGYVHAIAHSLGGKYNVPHGLANAVILPMVLETYGDSITHKLRSLALAVGLCDKHEDDKTAARMFIDAIKDMKKRFGIGDYIPEIQETDIPELAHYADKEANPLYPVPVLMDASELETLYYRLMPPAGNC